MFKSTNLKLIEKLILNNKLKEAFVLLKEQSKDIPEINILYSKLYLLQNKSLMALRYAKKALNQGSKSDEIYFILGNSYFNGGKYFDAITNFKKVKFKNVNINFLLFISLLLIGNIPSARQYLNAAIKLDKNKVKKLMPYFYRLFIVPNPQLTNVEKEHIKFKLHMQ